MATLPRLLPVRQGPRLFWFVFSLPRLGSWLMYSKLSCKLNPEQGRNGEREEKRREMNKAVFLTDSPTQTAYRLLVMHSVISLYTNTASHLPYQRELPWRGICWRKRQEKLVGGSSTYKSQQSFPDSFTLRNRIPKSTHFDSVPDT